MFSNTKEERKNLRGVGFNCTDNIRTLLYSVLLLLEGTICYGRPLNMKGRSCAAWDSIVPPVIFSIQLFATKTTARFEPIIRSCCTYWV
jgi:hypothetical protein